MRTVKIYMLTCPLTNSPKYIGKTVHSLNTRLSQHICDSRRYNTKVSNWIKSLVKKNLRPEIHLLEEVTDWELEEKFYISYFKYLGFDLKNLSTGGESGSEGYKHTEEEKRRMSERTKGRRLSDKQKKAIGDRFRGKKKSKESIEKFRRKMIGRRVPTHIIDKLRKDNPLLHLTERQKSENIEKVREAKCVSIVQISKDDSIIREWNCISDAVRALDISSSSIIHCLKGRSKKAGGYKWRYKK